MSHIIIKPNKYEHDLEHTDIGDNTNDTIDDPEAKEDSYTVWTPHEDQDLSNFFRLSIVTG